MTDANAPIGDWPGLAAAVHDLSRVLRAAGERSVGLDAITGSEHEVLRRIAAGPGRTVSAVARTLDQQPSNVSTTVRSLVARNLVERRPDPADGRRVLLYPTARATRHRELLDEAWTHAVDRALADLPGVDAEALAAAVPALHRLVAALDPHPPVRSARPDVGPSGVSSPAVYPERRYRPAP